MYKHVFTPIAHRGGSEMAFENTYEAFADAYKLGYRWLEQMYKFLRMECFMPSMTPI